MQVSICNLHQRKSAAGIRQESAPASLRVLANRPETMRRSLPVSGKSLAHPFDLVEFTFADFDKNFGWVLGDFQ